MEGVEGVMLPISNEEFSAWIARDIYEGNQRKAAAEAAKAAAKGRR